MKNGNTVEAQGILTEATKIAESYVHDAVASIDAAGKKNTAQALDNSISSDGTRASSPSDHHEKRSNVEKLMEAVERAEVQWPDWGDYTPEQASKYATASDAFTQLAHVHAASRRAVQMCATLASHCRAVADQLDENPAAHPRDLGLLSELLRQVVIRIRDAVINDPFATHPGPWWELAESVYQHAVQVGERITMIIPSIDQTNGPSTVAEIRLAARCRSLVRLLASLSLARPDDISRGPRRQRKGQVTRKLCFQV
ncbi:hypothetical protein [Mycolicibacterium peregrinum]|uniref:Uncharacterized protein n=1 Tax=Mycolicibacterium peregrinum TaxID=43304 RepID=A0A1A0VZA3_MYCPR|nr:hypothetical protein [Mycolicibacterium peregrinum]OBB88645.1 hypothetical protein A5779_00025 [Mycolicibacterium peregrinum]